MNAKMKALCVWLPLLFAAGQASAQEAPSKLTTFYLGAGSASQNDSSQNDDMPFSIGMMHQMEDRRLIVGADIAGEGTMLDSTYDRDRQPSQAMSFNVLVGSNVVDNGNFKLDAALLLGIRQSTADCPDSYLGFACYADAEPDVSYKGNFGGVVTMSFDAFVVGLRATGESAQILAGIRF